MSKIGNSNIIVCLLCFILFTTLLGIVYDPYTIHEGFDFFMIFKAIGSLFTGMLQLGKIFIMFLQALENFPKLVLFVIDVMFRFIPEFALWLVPFAICTFTKIMLIPRCGIWYTLDIVIYLCFTFLLFCFWIIDTGTMQDATSIFFYFLDIMEELDENLHDQTGMHFMHYPDSVNTTCYSCDTLPFPELPEWPF
jgi:hypothetical protein